MTPRTQMHLRLSESDYQFLKDRAAELDESVAALIRRILKGYRTKCEQMPSPKPAGTTAPASRAAEHGR